MESPINPKLWSYLFHGVAAVAVSQVALSLFRERRATLSVLDEPLKELSATSDPEAQAAALRAILSELSGRPAAAGAARLALWAKPGPVLDLLKDAGLLKGAAGDSSRTAVVEAAVRVVVKAFGNDADGRKALHNANGYRALFRALSEAHRFGDLRLMECLATALHTLTEVEDDLVLPTDVPHGTEGVAALAKNPSVAALVGIVKPTLPIAYLGALTGLMANIAALKVGAQAVASGNGMPAFLALLDHGNASIVEHGATAIRHLTRASYGREELLTAENAGRLARLLDPTRSTRTVSAGLTIVLMMIVDTAIRPQFLSIATECGVLRGLFAVLCNHPDRPVRDRSEALIRLLERTEAAMEIQRLMELTSGPRMERKAKDEEARRKQMQQMKQQQMMQQMMMSEMGMGMGMGMDEGDM